MRFLVFDWLTSPAIWEHGHRSKTVNSKKEKIGNFLNWTNKYLKCHRDCKKKKGLGGKMLLSAEKQIDHIVKQIIPQATAIDRYMISIRHCR